MKLDLLGNVVKVDKLDLPDDFELCNGTVIITDSDYVIEDASKYTNLVIHDGNFVLTKSMTKWQYIKCCLKLAWNKLVNG